jgi:protein SCO1/2
MISQWSARAGKIDRRPLAILLVILLSASVLSAADKYSVTGLIVRVDSAHRQLIVSCQEVPGRMGAMVMPFQVQDAKALQGLRPALKIRFNAQEDRDKILAENIEIVTFESLELDPTQARRLKLLEKIAAPKPRPDALAPGNAVPDFTFIDQSRQRVSLSELSGKVVAVTFIYTRCPFPDYCFRLSNNFGDLQKRFADRMGKQLVLLSVVIDPANDQPDAMAAYARTWKADTRSWHFLTGSPSDIEKLAHEFDMDFYPDEALYIHSFHTVLIDRQGRLAANLEGNDFTSKQLGDLVESMIAAP